LGIIEEKLLSGYIHTIEFKVLIDSEVIDFTFRVPRGTLLIQIFDELETTLGVKPQVIAVINAMGEITLLENHYSTIDYIIQKYGTEFFTGEASVVTFTHGDYVIDLEVPESIPFSATFRTACKSFNLTISDVGINRQDGQIIDHQIFSLPTAFVLNSWGNLFEIVDRELGDPLIELDKVVKQEHSPELTNGQEFHRDKLVYPPQMEESDEQIERIAEELVKVAEEPEHQETEIDQLTENYVSSSFPEEAVTEGSEKEMFSVEVPNPAIADVIGPPPEKSKQPETSTPQTSDLPTLSRGFTKYPWERKIETETVSESTKDEPLQEPSDSPVDSLESLSNFASSDLEQAEEREKDEEEIVEESPIEEEESLEQLFDEVTFEELEEVDIDSKGISDQPMEDLLADTETIPEPDFAIEEELIPSFQESATPLDTQPETDSLEDKVSVDHFEEQAISDLPTVNDVFIAEESADFLEKKTIDQEEAIHQPVQDTASEQDESFITKPYISDDEELSIPEEELTIEEEPIESDSAEEFETIKEEIRRTAAEATKLRAALTATESERTDAPTAEHSFQKEEQEPTKEQLESDSFEETAAVEPSISEEPIRVDFPGEPIITDESNEEEFETSEAELASMVEETKPEQSVSEQISAIDEQQVEPVTTLDEESMAERLARRRKELELLKQTIDSEATTKEPIAQRTTVIDFYDKMYTQKVYPLKIQTMPVEPNQRKEESQKAKLTIVPIFPGCHVTPRDDTIPLHSDTVALSEFSVTPIIARGKVSGKILLLYKGRNILTINVNTRIINTFWPKLTGFIGLFLGVLPFILELFTVEVNKSLATGFNNSFGTALQPNVFSWIELAILLAAIVATLGLIFGQRPILQSVTRKFYPFKPEE
jgi:hypothetical protein